MSAFITITGQKHYYGLLPFTVGSKVQLCPEPENLYDSAAIAVYAPPYGKVGSVAQSEEMRADGTISAATLLPQIKTTAHAQVRFIAGEYIIAEIIE